MSNAKTNLDAALKALEKEAFDEAIKCCKRVILWDSNNYRAYLYLGAAHTGLKQVDDALEAYEHAMDIDADKPFALQGLISLHEKMGDFDKVLATIDQLLPKLVLTGDGKRLVAQLNKKLDIYENKLPDEQKRIDTLQLYLPGSRYYDLIKDTKQIPDKMGIYRQLIAIAEKKNAAAIDTTYQNRRMRTKTDDPASLYDQVLADVYNESKLPFLYESLLNDPQAIDDHRAIQLKLLNIYRYQLLVIRDKAEVREKISQLVNALVSENAFDDALPYQISLEFTDVAKFDEYNTQLLAIFAQHFTDSAIAAVAQGYEKYKQGEIDDAFDLFGSALDQSPNLICGYLCLCWIYYESGEFDTGLNYATRGIELVKQFKNGTGIPLDKMLLSMELCLAHCYRRLDSKYYPDALAIYERILTKDENNIDALEGAGVILCQDGKYDKALERFQKVLALNETQSIALAEIGWIHALQEDYDKAIDFLTRAIASADDNAVDYYFKLGCVYWKMGGEYQSDKEYAFNYFMQAVRADPDYAAAFTYLGHYYRTIQQDDARAKKCYQKAYLLNPLDADAAFHLANFYVADGQNDQAETIFTQVTENNPKVSWAWRRLGYAHMKGNRYNEAISCFQKALRSDTGNARCWEGLGEAYSHEGRYVAALKAFERATALDPDSVIGKYQKALVKQKVGMLNVAQAEFETMVDEITPKSCAYALLPTKGLADTYLAQAKEDFQQGFFGRAADGCSKAISTCLHGLRQDPGLLCLWKLVGDACCFYRLIPSYLHLCNYRDIQVLIASLAKDAHHQLGFQPDSTSQLIEEFLQLDVDASDGFYLPPQAALDVMLACASFCYKKVLVLCHNHRAVAPPFWHDLALVYFWMAENNPAHKDSACALAINAIQVALSLDPAQASYWNAYGVMTMQIAPKKSQYAFVKAMEYNNRSAVPWTNYGFLCLSLQDYELANQAFEMALVLDPESISAWVGQAHVASVYNTSASNMFQHAFEASNGSSLDASYGYAEKIHAQLSTQPPMSDQDDLLLVAPAFALQKLTEQTQNNALALNLLGLLSERMGQHQRAAEAFAGAILALDSKLEEAQDDDDERNTWMARRAKVHANLGRALCATGDFQGAIQAYQVAMEHKDLASHVYCLLGMGVAYYFLDQLEDSLQMFEAALNDTANDVTLRQDVAVLLSKVLWALGGDEQRAVAKDQLLSCIADSPHYLPAIFSLAVMGILAGDDTLTHAALDELIKIPSDVAYDSDKDHWISWILSRQCKLQDDDRGAMQVLIKSIHQMPWVAALWARVGTDALTNDHVPLADKRVLAQSAVILAKEQHASAPMQSQAYQDAALADQSTTLAQRAILTAPWRMDAWHALATLSQ